MAILIHNFGKIKIMKLLYFSFLSLLLVNVFLISCNSVQSNSASSEAPTQDSLIKRGAHLVAIMGCNDCHTPKIFGPHGPELDSQRILSGYPVDMPLLSID